MRKITWLGFGAITFGLGCLYNPLAFVTGAIAFAAFIDDEPSLEG